MAEVVDQQQLNYSSGNYLGDESDWEIRLAQGFKLSAELEVTAVEIMRKAGTVGTPTGNWTLRIETNATNVPSGTLADPNASVVVVPPAEGNTVKGSFAVPFTLSGATSYWIVIQCDDQAEDNYWVIGKDADTYADGTQAMSLDGSWAWNSVDLYFKVYVTSESSSSSSSLSSSSSSSSNSSSSSSSSSLSSSSSSFSFSISSSSSSSISSSSSSSSSSSISSSSSSKSSSSSSSSSRSSSSSSSSSCRSSSSSSSSSSSKSSSSSSSSSRSSSSSSRSSSSSSSSASTSRGYINQKINFTSRTLYNISNKFSSALRTLSNISNFVNISKSNISNITNDIRNKKLIFNNLTNDIRFVQSWQKAVSGGILSRGKAYIKVYINTVEQTDVDVDSIQIVKDLNASHTATFDLCRAYDSTKPTVETVVQIKYDNWILFSGYVTQISPSEDPEKMRVNAQDEYWLQDRTNVYYNVGHKPTDDKELYYDTPKLALSTEHSWSLSIGNFVPQTVNNFATGKSSAITSLIEECGNYGWFYEVDKTKKLWIAGSGQIVDIHRQELGVNIALYDLIDHQFDESIENIVNKLRVQMGNRVINGNRTYTAMNYSSYHQFLDPAWDRRLEYLSNITVSGYGIDAPDPDLNYSDVFTKYYMPYLNPKLSSWSDAYPPYVEFFTLYGYFDNFVSFLNMIPVYTLKEGFTIDYQNRILRLNQPFFLYDTDANGQMYKVRAPVVRAFLWKKNYYTYTVDPNDDPEVDIANPLLFFTDKMGTYPTTIIKDLNLSGLSIQIGGDRFLRSDTVSETQTYTSGDKIFTLEHSGPQSMYIAVNNIMLDSANYSYTQNGVVTITSSLSSGDSIYFYYTYREYKFVPSWDDTEFARDYANWQLSKTCDKRITGTITITLDALCYYNIDLTKRIYIDGITEEAMNIKEINYNMSKFTATLTLENSRYYNRTVSYQSHEQ